MYRSINKAGVVGSPHLKSVISTKPSPKITVNHLYDHSKFTENLTNIIYQGGSSNNLVGPGSRNFNNIENYKIENLNGKQRYYTNIQNS